ncbi:glycerophosphodiester phosphodiesterase [Bombilactobacillus folatiphilus]|uniref:Glycerophosphodiester phosphodiesterase n=1 Tax=Bombilactobacillus folatiphilus TaxID=2923362 RepID=A0ABY4PA31_9LACO|nr:glycerophosphodiester phosphodiesterase [Bombilactobacillus folatiphilus]UQS82484.1 glycerophosphodiester phosphodiesterase [Bombilactobacillus folatiphilus]
MFKKSALTALISIILLFNSGFTVIGHRGNPMKVPEETFASINSAFDDGAQWVELDIHESNDNQLIISHDRNLDRVTGQNWIVSQHSASQLTQLKQSNGENIYTIDQLFAQYQNQPNTKFLIETKKTKHNNPKNMEALLVAAINKYYMQSRVMVHSFSLDSLENMKALAPQIPRIFIAGSLKRLTFEVFQTSNAVNVSSALLTPRLIDQLHAIGQKVFVWDEMTENPKQWNWLINLPIDGIVTNFPERAVYYQQLKKNTNQSNTNFMATLLNNQSQPIWENPYPNSPQRGQLEPNSTVHIQKEIDWEDQTYFQIDTNRFIAANGLVQSLFTPNLAPFLNQQVVVKNGPTNRNLRLDPNNFASQQGSLVPNQVYWITALQNVNGQNWAQINYRGWIQLQNLLVSHSSAHYYDNFEQYNNYAANTDKKADHLVDINEQITLKPSPVRLQIQTNVSQLPAITYTCGIASNLNQLKNNAAW